MIHGFDCEGSLNAMNDLFLFVCLSFGSVLTSIGTTSPVHATECFWSPEFLSDGKLQC